MRFRDMQPGELYGFTHPKWSNGMFLIQAVARHIDGDWILSPAYEGYGAACRQVDCGLYLGTQELYSQEYRALGDEYRKGLALIFLVEGVRALMDKRLIRNVKRYTGET